MGYVRQYDSGVNWENTPSTNTPINQTNLNQMDNAIMDVDAEAKRAIDAVEASIATLSPIDTDTSTTSTHPLQNKVITNRLRDGKFMRCAEATVSESYHYIAPGLKIGDDFTGMVCVAISSDSSTPSGGQWDLRLVYGSTYIDYPCIRSYFDGNSWVTENFGDELKAQTVLIFNIMSNNAILKGIVGMNEASGIIPIANGGTGNSDGYIRTGRAGTSTIGLRATIEGFTNIASGENAHAENLGNTASGDNSHAEGSSNTAQGLASHASGTFNTAGYANQFVLGYYNQNKSDTILEIGNGTYPSRHNAFEVYQNGNVVAGGTITDGNGNSITAVEANPAASASASLTKLKVGSTVYGISGGGSGSTVTITPTLATGTKIADYTIDSVAGELYAPSGGGLPADPLPIANGGTGNSVGYIQTGLASGYTAGTKATSEGAFTAAEGDYSHSEGYQTNASGESSHTEGYQTIASANFAHAEGNYTKASGIGSHAEGRGTEQDSQYQYIYTEASGNYAHAEGRSSVASGDSAHAEGKLANATGDFSHAEGQENTASNTAAHAEGYLNTASGVQAHAEGARNTASGAQAHAGGRYNVAGYAQQTVIGRFNDNKSDTLFEVGNGTATNARSNAFEVLANGDIQAYGHITDGYGHVLGSSSETISYQIVTKDTSGASAAVTVKKYVNGVLDSSTDYLYEDIQTPVNIDGYLTLVYGQVAYSYTYTLLQTSDDHASGYSYSWGYDATIDITEDFTVGGGGTEVEANPSGTATADLTKVKIDDTIYNVGAGLSTAQLNTLLALI